MIRSHGTKVTLTSRNVAEMRLIPRGSLRDRARPDTPVLAWDTNTPPLPRAEAGAKPQRESVPVAAVRHDPQRHPLGGQRQVVNRTTLTTS
jgi:hypothetical protein